MRWVRFFLGGLLIPCCFAAVRTLGILVQAADPASSWLISPTGLLMAGGFLLWLFFYIALPRPLRAYVLAHELSHALWGLLHGRRVSQLRVSRQGGSVRIEKPNTLIVLAPYFFPFYTILVVLAYGIGSIFTDLTSWRPVWLAAVGLTWGFHVTFTVSALLDHQSDIQKVGHLFSYTFIFWLNALGLALWLVAVGPASLLDLGTTLARESWVAARFCGETLATAAIWIYNKIDPASV
jgi:hypothetical protein